MTILSDVAELPEQIDVVPGRDRQGAGRAGGRGATPENEEAQAALARAELRLEVTSGT